MTDAIEYRAPSGDSLSFKKWSDGRVTVLCVDGAMRKQYATTLTDEQRIEIAEYLSD